jgi:hypothetical protein
MADPSFQEALARALAGGDMVEALESFRQLTSAADARALVLALDRMPTEGAGMFGPLHLVAGYYLAAEDEAVASELRKGFPRLLALYDRTLATLTAADKPFGKKGDLLSALKVFAFWPDAGGEDALQRVLAAMHNPLLCDAFQWSVIFQLYARDDHPLRAEVARRARDPLPADGFVAITFLDFVNTLCRDRALAEHPYRTEAGIAFVEAQLRQTKETSYAHSATAALPFLPASARAKLLGLATVYPNADVRLEAAWADVRAGGTAGLFTLVGMCRDPHATKRAQAYLEELGRADAIPPDARDRDFVAMAEMSSWLQHPSEFGAPPDELRLYDTRELLWPPTDDCRRVWLFEYTYEKPWGREGTRKAGLGMVGSITFALVGETMAGLPAEDAYAIHCCWELQMNKDPRAPQDRSAVTGRRLLGFA